MKMRCILAMLLICMMILNPIAAIAENQALERPDALTYTGGIVKRSYANGIMPYRLTPQIELGYALANSPYLILGRPTVWDVVISGGTQPYSCEVWLAFREDSTQNSWPVVDWFELEGDSFTYVFDEPGEYFWQFNVTDAAGQELIFQTRHYETYTEADETDETTVAGKVNSIIASEITPGMSDYTRARVLHDWLTQNANYDYTFTYYDASGVLLHKRGVCDSYARAYLMLMTAAGVDCIIVTGTAGGQNHAWNMVKLNGSWYHVDCTWDDPGEGGHENHAYFCVDDETMALDHTWNIADFNGMMPPEAGGEYADGAASDSDYDFTFSTIDELNAAFDAEVAAGNYRENTTGLYTGSADIYSDFGAWCNTKAQELANKGLITAAGYSYTGNLMTISLTWRNPDDYIRINEESLRISIDSAVVIKPGEYTPKADAFVWESSNPDVATVISSYNETDGLTAVVTAIATGKTTITATSADGLSDSVEVTVLDAYKPDFDFEMNESGSCISLSWNLIPGATEYRVIHAKNGSETVLSTVTTGEYEFSGTSLPVNTLNELYVKAVRVVGSADSVTFASAKLPHVTLSFDSTLPSGVLTIEREAFTGDTSLETLYIPDGITSIGVNAFANSGIDVIRIPDSITSINAEAFAGSSIDFLQTTRGSAADIWFQNNMKDVYIKYE